MAAFAHGPYRPNGTLSRLRHGSKRTASRCQIAKHIYLEKKKTEILVTDDDDDNKHNLTLGVGKKKKFM